ncbi:D-amino-acid transaminase [Xanthobacter sp. KR7-225]|uniref:D-amino-acid transaminase n=1 Tax=Xanthobacter sp. KR7-225 TaxID=3156613 RepID=UPI0032B4B5E6
MSRIAYVNGRYLPHRSASVHVEDRGYQFSDGVYEVCEVRGGRLVDARRHLDRLDRSLSELRIAAPMGRAALTQVLKEVVARNGVKDGIVYLQVTRGVARRDHAFPAPGTAPSLVVTARRADPAAQERLAEAGVRVICVPENRWPRVDIKTVGLLPNVLAKQQAKEAGAREAWFVDAAGYVTEGSSTNAWIVTTDGRIVTRPAESGILKGITRAVVMEAARALGLVVEERAFTPQEAYGAREAFITAASTVVMPVVEIDGRAVGNAHPGAVALELRQRFHAFAEVT